MKPMLVDTTELFDEILERARSSQDFRLIDATHAGRARIFAALHVASEVPAKLREKFARRGASPQVGLQIWESDYLPYIYFVDTEGLPTRSIELERLGARDPSDLAQARLTALLSPIVSLSSDKDLTENGFAVSSRWRTAQSARMQLEGEAGYLAVVLPGGLAWAGVTSAVHTAGRTWGRPGKIVVTGAAIGGLWLLVRTIKNAQPETRARLLSVVESVMEMFVEATEKQELANKQLTQLQILAPGVIDSLLRDIGRLLSSASEPMTATKISRDLWVDQGPVPQSFFLQVRDLLSQLPAFVQVEDHRWQLGRIQAA
jgi:hypothetical protein